MLLLVFTILLEASVVVSFEKCTGPIPAAEYEALQSLYESADGSQWRFVAGLDPHFARWTFPSNLTTPCATNYIWQGLTCSYDRFNIRLCHVGILFLYEFNLQGTIPSQIATLEYLDTLVFSSNNLFGLLPSELSRLSSLTM